MQSSEPDPSREPRVVSLADADGMIEALSSGTARSIVTALESEPKAAAELAEAVDTSLQNAVYHLERLSEAGLVEVVGTRYSTRGREMDLYAPSSAPVVICAGDETSEDTVARIVEDDGSTARVADSD